MLKSPYWLGSSHSSYTSSFLITKIFHFHWSVFLLLTCHPKTFMSLLIWYFTCPKNIVMRFVCSSAPITSLIIRLIFFPKFFNQTIVPPYINIAHLELLLVQYLSNILGNIFLTTWLLYNTSFELFYRNSPSVLYLLHCLSLVHIKNSKFHMIRWDWISYLSYVV